MKLQAYVAASARVPHLTCTPRLVSMSVLYTVSAPIVALSLFCIFLSAARNEHYRASRVLFERLLQSYPTHCKCWISYAVVR